MRFLATLLILSILVQPCLADVIALKDGTKLEGTVANAPHIRAGRYPAGKVSILVGDDLHRIDLDRIDYIALGEGPEMVVIDPNLETRPGPPDARPIDAPGFYEQRMQELEQQRSSGIIQAVLGLGVAAIGVFVKFGNEKVEITSNSVDYHEKSYDTLNYALMAGGGLLAVLGVANVGSANSEMKTLELTRPQPVVGLAWRF